MDTPFNLVAYATHGENVFLSKAYHKKKAHDQVYKFDTRIARIKKLHEELPFNLNLGVPNLNSLEALRGCLMRTKDIHHDELYLYKWIFGSKVVKSVKENENNNHEKLDITLQTIQDLINLLLLSAMSQTVSQQLDVEE